MLSAAACTCPRQEVHSACSRENSFSDEVFPVRAAGQLKRVASLMQACGMPVPAWMTQLPKAPTVLKQQQKDRRKRGLPARPGLLRAPKRHRRAANASN